MQVSTQLSMIYDVERLAVYSQRLNCMRRKEPECLWA